MYMKPEYGKTDAKAIFNPPMRAAGGVAGPAGMPEYYVRRGYDYD
jgi:hypothetical protein